MTEYFKSGISGLDELISGDGVGGIPEGTVTLLYGPPKVGKSIFCYQFAYNGLLENEPCLYIAADYTWNQLQQKTMNFNWFLQSYMQEQDIFVIDLLSRLSGEKLMDSVNYKASSLQDPADMMIKVGTGTRVVFQKSSRFRSVFDSLTTQFAFNPSKLVLRVIKAYIDRIKDANGVAVISHTYGSVEPQIDEQLVKLVDNLIIMDGTELSFESSDVGPVESNYSITDSGIILKSK